jgi:hypothetical protein
MGKDAAFRVVQPWGHDRARQATIVSTHATASEAFAEIDRLAERMVRTGDRSDAVALIVVNEHGDIIERPGTH